MALAALLVQAPSLYLLDEPTAHQDIAHQLAMLRMIRQIATTNTAPHTIEHATQQITQQAVQDTTPRTTTHSTTHSTMHSIPRSTTHATPQAIQQAVIMNCHDINLAARFATHVLLLGENNHWSGPVDQLLTIDLLAQTFQCRFQMIEAAGQRSFIAV